MPRGIAATRLFGDDDLPTTDADVQALRAQRPPAGDHWLDDLATLASLASETARTLRQRRTFAGQLPFEL